jgi:predicted type IV restriction endonuclease
LRVKHLLESLGFTVTCPDEITPEERGEFLH